MKPGDLRKFNALGFMTLNPYVTAERIADQTFVVISLYPPNWNLNDPSDYVDFLVIEVDDGPMPTWVTFLANSACQRHWLYAFVLLHSEVLNASR